MLLINIEKTSSELKSELKDFKIIIGPSKLQDSKNIIHFIHELGHIIDYKKNPALS